MKEILKINKGGTEPMPFLSLRFVQNAGHGDIYEIYRWILVKTEGSQYIFSS